MTKRITDFSTVIEFFFCNEMEEKKKIYYYPREKVKNTKKINRF